MKYFWIDAVSQGARQLVDTRAIDIWHSQTDAPTHSSRPSFVIKAVGPSFELPATGSNGTATTIGFSNIASCIEIQVDSTLTESTSEQLARAAIYARQIFLHQPNRQFVRVLILTGHNLRLFHFDSSGAQYTPLLDIHSDPHTFVRLVLGLSSPNEADIGLDTSIQWLIENGQKVSGTLTTRGTYGTDVVYPLLNINPFFSRSYIRGRCTTCWSVSEPRTGEWLLVKDSWRPDDKVSESVYLQEARGISGVAQMISCEPDRGQTKDLRSPGSHLPEDFQNRVNTRLVMKCYGAPIRKFTSASQLLRILRDAIAGHRMLLRKGILHRDVSPQNILAGKPAAQDGDRGVLIDFDMAIRYHADGINLPADWKIGTRLYQSAMVLYSRDVPKPLIHDHLDDLESFFYVFTHIIHEYDCHGVFYGLDDDSDLKAWDENEGRAAAIVKRGFLAASSTPHDIASRWPEACIQADHKFQDFIRVMVQKKMAIIHKSSANPADLQKPLQLSFEEHYDHVLRLFDEGMEALEVEEAQEAASKCVKPTPPSPTLASTERNALKRASDDYPDAQPAAKRVHSPRVVRNLRSPPHSNPRSA
ncbi:hypothetical protein MD484_g6305, partial [Candolleomyces efflorescens]